MDRRQFLALCAILCLPLPVVGKTKPRRKIGIKKCECWTGYGHENRWSYSYPWEYYDVFENGVRVGKLRLGACTTTCSVSGAVSFMFKDEPTHPIAGWNQISFHSEVLDKTFHLRDWFQTPYPKSEYPPIVLAKMGIRLARKEMKKRLAKITTYIKQMGDGPPQETIMTRP